jgi:hypothetical protein
MVDGNVDSAFDFSVVLMWSVLPTFRRYMLPPSSGSKGVGHGSFSVYIGFVFRMKLWRTGNLADFLVHSVALKMALPFHLQLSRYTVPAGPDEVSAPHSSP